MKLPELITQLRALRDEISNKNAELKKLAEAKAELEGIILGWLDEQGLQRAAAGSHVVSITETVVPSVKDWGKLHAFITSENALYLLERRVSSTAYRELLELRGGDLIPGVESFTKQALSLRADG